MATPQRWATRPVANAEQIGRFLAEYHRQFGRPPKTALISPHTRTEVSAALRQAGVRVLQREYVLTWEVWLGPLPEDWEDAP